MDNINFKKVLDDGELFDQQVNYEENFEKINQEVVPKITDLETNKVDKVAGKGLSTNDFDNTYKQKIDTDIPAQLNDMTQDFSAQLADIEQKVDVDIPVQLNEKANKVQAGWITPTLLNGYTNYGYPFANVSYFKDDFGIVHLKGVAKLSVEKTSNGLFSLPNGYRPTSLLYIPYMAGDYIYTLSIASTGAVSIYQTSKLNWISLDGISFKVGD